MAQTPLSVYSFKPGGLYSALGVNAPTVIKNSPGVVYRVICVTVPSAGSLVVNDLATTTGSATANIILSVAFGNITQGEPFILEVPTNTGIALTSVGTGGVFTVTYS